MNILKVGNVVLDLDDKTVFVLGNTNVNTSPKILLSQQEFLFLKFLMENKNKPFSPQEIIENAWLNKFVETSSVKEYIQYLRKKVGKNVIINRWGVGYGIYDNGTLDNGAKAHI